jgi:hypothetical protein
MSYAAQTTAAARMIGAKGTPLTLTRRAAGQVATQTILAVIMAATPARDLTFAERSAVLRDQRQLLIAGVDDAGAALTLEPTAGDTVAFESATWTVGGVTRQAPDGGTPILYLAEVTR